MQFNSNEPEINYVELEAVKKELTYMPLNLMHLGRIFGTQFWSLFALCITGQRIEVENDKIHIHVHSEGKEI